MRLTPVQHEALSAAGRRRLWLAYNGSGIIGAHPTIERRLTRRTMNALRSRGLIHHVLPYSGSSSWPYIPCQTGPGARRA